MTFSPDQPNNNTDARLAIRDMAYALRVPGLLLLALLCAGVMHAQDPFITTWKTDNPGTSNNKSITIPTTGSGYLYDVDWENDGTFEQTGLTGSVTHEYAAAGTYTVAIRGTFPRIYFNDGGDRRKLLSVTQWGDIAWSSMASAFEGCSNLQITATDVPDLSAVTRMDGLFSNCFVLNGPVNIGSWNTENVTDMRGMFAGAIAFNQNIGAWNTKNVTNMRGMFSSATKFNQDIGAWNTEKVTDMQGMFSSASAYNQDLGDWTLNGSVTMDSMLNASGMDCEQYSATLIGWSNNPATPNGRAMSTSGRLYGTNAVAARTNLVSVKGWSLNDFPTGVPCPSIPFLTTWKTDTTSFNSSNSKSVTIPTTGSGYNYDVDWENDGTFDQTGVTGSVTHEYAAAGTYTVAIRGMFPRIYFNNGGDKIKLLDVKQWGDIAWSSMESAFYGCSNLQISATDVPDLSGVTDMVSMFRLCESLNGPANIGSWNTEKVTNMSFAFAGASAFDQAIGTWNTANVTNMSYAFIGAGAFNQDIGTWNTEKVTDMSGMFASTSAFNQDIGAWNTGKVTDMSSMFDNTIAFNQSIGTWNTATVTSFFRMFRGAESFNKPLADWNTANVTNMDAMFGFTLVFDQPIGNWNTTKVTDMSSMFEGAEAFNQPIGTWNTAKVTDMSYMFFRTKAFNQSISDWNTVKVTDMNSMFEGVEAFNQPIGNWNTANVDNMYAMFFNAGAFNQPIGNWILNSSVNMTNMLTDCGMDCANYSATLVGWSNNPATPTGRVLSAFGMEYGTNAAAERTNLTGAKGWTIVGDAPSGVFCGNVVSGTILWERDGVSGVKDATVNATGNGTGSGTTDGDGAYLVNLSAGGNITITPTKNINKFNGVTAADATRIQQHVTGNPLLGAPYPRIAADVNKNNAISVQDASLIKQALLGNQQANAQWNTSWRFVDADYVFPNPNAPWNFPESVSLTGVGGPVTDVDFTGVKLGDVTTPAANPALRPEPVVLRSADQVLQAGQSVAVPMTVEGFAHVAAYQFVLHFDPELLALEHISTPEGGLLSPQQFGTYQAADGEIRSVFSQAEGSDVDNGAVFFTLHFMPQQSGVRLSEVIGLDASLLPAEAYTPDIEVKPIELVFNQISATWQPNAPRPSLRAQPNPATDQTQLHFTLPTAEEALLRVLDLNGKVLLEQRARYDAGAHVLPVAFSHGGVYVAELRTARGVEVVKMVVE